MEGLRKLEQLQRAISLMQSSALVDSFDGNADSDRFLASFFLFLSQPCGKLDMETKRQLISKHLFKISAAFLEEAMLQHSGDGDELIENAIPLDCDDKAGVASLQTDYEDMAVVGLDAMQRSNSTLEDFVPYDELSKIVLVMNLKTVSFAAFLNWDIWSLLLKGWSRIVNLHLKMSSMKGLASITNLLYHHAMLLLEAFYDAHTCCNCRSYFMFHEMDAKNPQSIFRYLPMLSFTESYIYQLDTLNEKLLRLPTHGVPSLGRDLDVTQEPEQNFIIKFMKVFRTDPFRPLADLLDRHGLLTDRIREEFRCGEEYWTLERKLCCALASKKKFSVEDVMRAIHLKSFDYRVLNLLLYQLRGEKVNELHMEFLSISEFLVEVSDDLFDYEDDVLENNFNILRMFVRIYGTSAAPTMLAKCITDAEWKYEHLLDALDPKLSANYRGRCEEATKEGGRILGPSLGTWSIPSLIEDEDSFRFDILNSGSSSHL